MKPSPHSRSTFLLATLLLLWVGCARQNAVTPEATGGKTPAPSTPALGGPLTAGLLRQLAPIGIRSPEELRTVLEGVEGHHVRRHRRLLRQIDDAVTARILWSAQGAQQPDDVEAHFETARALLELGHPDLALEPIELARVAFANKTDPNGSTTFKHDVAPVKCQAYWALGNLEQARMHCEYTTRMSRQSAGPRNMAKALLLLGQADKALERTEQALKLRGDNGASWYVRGVVLASLGRTEEAQEAWRRAVKEWPDFSPARDALRRAEQQKIPGARELFTLEDVWQTKVYAARLARCGRIYLELQLSKQAERCFEAAERLEKGSSGAARVAYLAGWDAAGAEKLARDLLPRAWTAELQALLARLVLARGETTEAFMMLRMASQLEPDSIAVHNTLVQACTSHSHAICDRSARGWYAVGATYEEDYPRPGGQLDSRFAEKRSPPSGEFLLQPMGDMPLPETEGLVEVLSQRFPGFSFRLLPLRPLPPGIFRGEQLIFEYLMPHLPQQTGLFVLTSRDLTSRGMNFAYGGMETDGARGVVSVSRFRSADGSPTASDLKVEGPTLELSRQRLQNQVTSSVGKALGMSAPCPEKQCVLRYPRGYIQEFDEKGGKFCPKHQAELKALPRPPASKP